MGFTSFTIFSFCIVPRLHSGLHRLLCARVLRGRKLHTYWCKLVLYSILFTQRGRKRNRSTDQPCGGGKSNCCLMRWNNTRNSPQGKESRRQRTRQGTDALKSSPQTYRGGCKSFWICIVVRIRNLFFRWRPDTAYVHDICEPSSFSVNGGPVSRKTRKRFEPVKPFLVNLCLRNE